MSKTYAEKLQDPRWQRKRLQVMERNDFKCQNCDFVGTGREPDAGPLHIHHCWYEKGVAPWDYDDSCYQCLCETCHIEAEALRLKISKMLFTLLPTELDDIAESVKEFRMVKCGH